MKVLKGVFWFLGQLLLIGAIIFVGTLVAQIALELVPGIFGVTLEEDFIIGASGSFGVAVSGIVLCLIVSKMKTVSFIEKKEKFSFGKAVVLATLVMCVCKIIYNSLYTGVFSGVLPIVADEEREESVIMMVIMSVILAPIMEELLFRKGFYSILRSRCGKILSIAVNSIVFAAIHGYNPKGFVSCLIAGIIFCYLYEATGVVMYSIAAHMMCNLESLISTLLMDSGATLWGKPLVYEINGFTAYHGLIVAVALIVIVMAGAYFVIKQKRGKNVVSDTCC